MILSKSKCEIRFTVWRCPKRLFQQPLTPACRASNKSIGAPHHSKPRWHADAGWKIFWGQVFSGFHSILSHKIPEKEDSKNALGFNMNFGICNQLDNWHLCIEGKLRTRPDDKILTRSTSFGCFGWQNLESLSLSLSLSLENSIVGCHRTKMSQPDEVARRRECSTVLALFIMCGEGHPGILLQSLWTLMWSHECSPGRMTVANAKSTSEATNMQEIILTLIENDTGLRIPHPIFIRII